MTRYYHCIASSEEPLSEKELVRLNARFKAWAKGYNLQPVAVMQTEDRPPLMRFDKTILCTALIKRKNLFE